MDKVIEDKILKRTGYSYKVIMNMSKLDFVRKIGVQQMKGLEPRQFQWLQKLRDEYGSKFNN
jgi:hypothetical protein